MLTLINTVVAAQTAIQQNMSTLQSLVNQHTLQIAQLATATTTTAAPSGGIQAYASMYYAVAPSSSVLSISDASTFGMQMLFNRAGPARSITVNTATSQWTHAYIGTYLVTVSYRQNSGADVWTVLAVTRGGNSFAVGVSSRTGSEDSHNEDYRIVYTVDSTVQTYQLQHWSTTGKTVTSGFGGGPPGWANYATLCGGFTGDAGRLVDYSIVRLGD